MPTPVEVWNKLDVQLDAGETLANAQATVGTSAVQIAPVNETRESICFKSRKTNTATIYVGSTSGVTTGSGHAVDPGEPLTLGTHAAVYAISDSASQVLTILEESR